MSKNVTVGLLAHVDAGKTTLAEAMLYLSGASRAFGRVDKGDTLLDNHELEKERGITIFAGQALLEAGGTRVTLLDTPGHVDFSAETERILRILDYAVLVISGTDGVQSHTLTLWRLLREYSIPVIIFVTKMDFGRRSREELMLELKKEFGDCCVAFDGGEPSEETFEELATCSEEALDEFLASGRVSGGRVASLIAGRSCFPCLFGSGLKLEGVGELLRFIDDYTVESRRGAGFGARVFKITHDKNGGRLTHMRITGGALRVKDVVKVGGSDEKVDQIRVYNGPSFTVLEEAPAGTVCTCTGLTGTFAGMGLGTERDEATPLLEPVMTYRVILPDDVDAKTFMPKLRQLEEEDPLLRVSWEEHLQEISVCLMGTVQAEILKSVVSSRFGVDIDTDRGRVLYRETITNTVEGVGHYEPLRHYAEVHLILSPGERGSGITVKTACSEDSLDRNWQRLIMMHVAEKQHLGVLTGSPLTDVVVTLAAGRAHVKHTEGGDFRQATYRAVRQGLMQAESVLLEPYYSFRLEVPDSQLGRAINDLRARHADFDAPVKDGDHTLIRGSGPVTSLNGYASELAAYTSGRGRLLLSVERYGPCHDADKVMEAFAYDPEADVENTPDSVFCAHGGGFQVKWDKVPEYMHIESCLKKEKIPYEPVLNRRNFRIDDKELEAIMTREFGPPGETVLYRGKPESKAEEREFELRERKKYCIIDGYNCIFASDDLKAVAETSLDSARVKLLRQVAGYSAFTHCECVVVFDAYLVDGGKGSRFDKDGVHVVFTRENETADAYIEHMISEIGRNYNVTVVTSDNMIRLSAAGYGVLRLSAAAFAGEMEAAHRKMDEIIKKKH